MPKLLRPLRIERLSGVEDGESVPVANGSEARWARDGHGRQWVRKRESDTGFQALLAEAASYLLGQELGVPQPKGAVYHDDQEWSWMSRRVVAAAEHWSPDMRDLIENIEEVGRMLTLDALTFNEDRHRQNILVEPVEDEAHLRLWAIDSGDAKIGWPENYMSSRLSTPDPRNHARGLPIELLGSAAMEAADVAAKLPDATLRAIVVEACGLVREPAVDGLTAALIGRCRDAPSLVSSYLDALGALR